MSATRCRQTRVVVIGAGMVGHRFVEELVRLDTDGRFQIVLVGAEAHQPYNRILLSDVLAGRCDLTALTMPLPHARVDFRRGVSATALDRAAGDVQLSDGNRTPYDVLVLATGARAFVPPLPGLDQEPRHVHVLRSIDDCRDLTARAVDARHAVVLGGGVLGVEAACGLRRRGLAVTVLDLDATLMAGQLDPAPGAVLAGRLAELGIDARPGTSIREVVVADGAVSAVRLSDDSLLAADLLLLSCGIRAEDRLAAAAGLRVDRGVLVGADLSTDDPRVFALGDCARTQEGASGLLAPGWRQAERLAEALVGGGSTDGGRPTVSAAPGPGGVTLKAAGVDLVTLGTRASAALPDDRVITVSDARANRHVDLVLRAERLVGVTCLGAADLAPGLTVAFERATPLPPDPLGLLLPERGTPQESSPLRMPGGTTVCRCNTVTKQDIVTAWEAGADSVERVVTATRATTGCGGCREVVCGLVEWLDAGDPATTASRPEPERATRSVARV